MFLKAQGLLSIIYFNMKCLLANIKIEANSIILLNNSSDFKFVM